MTTYLKAVTAAAALLCASQAQAASFITYTITGTASFTIADRNSVAPVRSAGTYEATHVIPIGVFGLTEPTTIESGQYANNSSLYSASFYGPSLSLASAIGNRLTFQEIGRSAYSSDIISYSAFNLCLSTSTGNAFPTTGTLAVDTSCSSAVFDFPRGGQTILGVLGTITGATASISDVRPSTGYGFGALRITSLVPEPATWALMLAGFAMTGYALRRRRAPVAFA